MINITPNFSRKILIVLFFLIVFAFLSPVNVKATNHQTTTTNTITTDSASGPESDKFTKYTFLAPFSEQYKIFDLKDGACPFGRYVNLLITIFLGVSAVLAMLMIIVGGIQWMTTELISAKEEGKKKITSAVLGLILALAAYLILKTINPNILNLCFDVPVATIEIKNLDEPQTAVNGQFCANPAYASGSPWNEQAIGKKLTTLSPWASVNNGECTKVGQKGCTSLLGFDPYIINRIRFYCSNCEIIVTGATECWEHSREGSHKPGSPTTDLRSTGTTNLDAYIRSGKPGKGNWFVKDGINFLYEGDHWHAQK
jgi:type IV secretory pathway VirB2 component (pilin)